MTLADTIARLRHLSQLDIRDRWRVCDHDLPIAEGCDPTRWQDWAIAPCNNKGYILWERGHQPRWLCQVIIVPEHLQGYSLDGMVLRLALTVWTDPTLVFVNGQLMQECDLFDHSPRVLLSERVTPGDRIAVALRLVSPSHDDGALMKSICLYETNPSACLEGTFMHEPGFIADELAVLEIYLQALQPEQLSNLMQAVQEIDWDAVDDRPRFQQSIRRLYDRLQPLSDWIKQRQICLLGHSHLDLVWLWTWAETCDVAERMFKSVLSLQQDDSALVFCHSSPVLYAWVEEHRPALFAAIREQIQAGRWEALGGMWVEPELNLLHGESLVRQVLYGQRYVRSRFGRLDRIAWLPDSFGFCWQLPQILSQGGIEYLVTQKLTWNDCTKFPHAAFWWQAPDGSRVFTVMSSPVGEGIDPVKMATYASQWEQATGLSTALWLFGVGDHGGGPTRDMLNVADRWRRSPFFPNLVPSLALDYLVGICEQHPRQKTELQKNNAPHSASSALQAPSFPVWQDELYLECHRGSYTTHGDQKRWNRQCEILLYQAELWSSLVTIATQAPYPHAQLTELWRRLLFNQFHDILPGSSIPEVFVEANVVWQHIEQEAALLRDRALMTLVQHIDLPAPPFPDCQPIVVVNSLNWQRSQVVTLTGVVGGVVLDLDGRDLPSQELDNGHLAFLAKDVPSVGYRVYWWRAQHQPDLPQATGVAIAPETNTPETEQFVLENAYLRVIIDPATGDLASVVTKSNQRETLGGAGNQLQAFADKHKYWDAWNIDPDYEQYPLPPSELRSIQWIDRGEICQRVRVVRTISNSTFQQDYVLDVASPLIRIETIADWQDHHIILKAAFPLATSADYATYEIPCGAIQRPTQSEEPMQRAKWEVPALRWADLAGVSLLNDCKYAYDSKPHQLRLTLLRGSCWPDPQADLGHHRFAYAFYPHCGQDWKQVRTVQHGYEFNQPLHVVYPTGNIAEQFTQAVLPPTGQLLGLQAETVVLMALKRCEDNPMRWILRCYEAHGQLAALEITSDLTIRVVDDVDVLERSCKVRPSVEPAHPDKIEMPITIAPWKIVSLALTS